MVFRLYVEEAETGKEIFCGGKIYGYDTPSECNFCGAFWLYYHCAEFKEDIDWYIENYFPLSEYSLAEIFDNTFNYRLYFDYLVDAETVRGFLAEYLKDWQVHFKIPFSETGRKIEIDDAKRYKIRWF